MSSGVPRTRSLWPREHGAYIQLLVPILTALVATPSLAGAAIALGAGLAFVASEPLRVLLGDRGARMRKEAGARARRRLALLVPVALLSGGLGLAFAPRAALAFAAAVTVPNAIVLVLSRRRAVHTILGESIAALALAGAAAPVAIAGGVTPRGALILWAAWSAGWATTVVAVHHVIARHRRAASRADLPRALAMGLLCAAIVALGVHEPMAWIAAPLAVVASGVLIYPPRATHMRAVGIGFLMSSLVSAGYALALALA